MDTPVTRRAMIRGAVVTAGAGVVGFVVANNSSYAKQKRASSAANSAGYTGTKRRQLTTLSAVPANGGVVLAKDDVVITRDSGGDVHAFSATCTHQGCQVTSVKDGQIFCPCHGSRFDANTGKVVAGPAPRPLPTVTVTVEGNGIFAG
ncbi:MAG: Rieske (2Fe-2S) protein [Actinomycetes bacterium]